MKSIPALALYGLCVAVLFALPGCTLTQRYVAPAYEDWEDRLPPADDELVYRVFLLGDAGSPATDGTEPSLQLLQTMLSTAGEESAVVFLGDNIYCCGLPDSASIHRAQAERRIQALLATVEDHPGRVFFIPGNHDWQHSGEGGLETVIRQERYIEAALDRDDVFLPGGGFPGPYEVKLTDDLVLIALDTQWWLTPRELKPFGETGTYNIDEKGDVLLELNDILRNNRNEHVLVVGHHPVLSNGLHSGYFPLSTHIFPLTARWRRAFVPIPFLGSIYPVFTRYLGGQQDLNHPNYKSLRRGLLQTFATHESLVYAAGHEHNLQVFESPGTEPHQHFIVSGSATRTSPVAKGQGAQFVYSESGFATIQYYRDGSVWVEIWTPGGEDGEGTLQYRYALQGPARDAVDPGVPTHIPPEAYPDYRDSTYVTAANPDYSAGPVKSFLWGTHNRDIWALPVEVPYLDMGRDGGGLLPIKRGGGMQTFSLRLQGGDGKQYVIRSVDKDPSVSVPPNLRGTIVTEVVQDQIASINPYGAYIVPRLAGAAGIIHTNPRLVYVPRDPRLGTYLDEFGGQLMMFEERPDEDMSDWPSYQGAEDIVSADRLYAEVNEDNDHRVDQEAFVRARLFDMLISDWDRHRYQWRWAAFEPADKQGKIYHPVPRDRDWAFNRFNGLLPNLVKAFFDPKFQEFDDDFGNIKGLTRNGLEQDRRFTARLSRDQWIAQADTLRAALTDDVIEAAVRDLPDAAFAVQGEDLIATLKARRDQLTDVAGAYYEVLAKVVGLVGSNKHERFEVQRLDDEHTEVVVYKTNKEGEIQKELFRRTFKRSETEEIRLYGQDGNDQFVLSGAVRKGIRVIVVGGTGADRFEDTSQVAGLSKKTHIYDTPTGNTWVTGRETRTYPSTNPSVHRYDPRAYQHDVMLPQLFFGGNDDDGVFLGGGVKIIRHGFRKRPYARAQRVVANVATRTQAFNLLYEGHYVRMLGRLDARLDASWFSPDNIRNFHGLGNTTTDDQGNRNFYQARLTQFRLAPSLGRQSPLGFQFFFGPTFSYTRVRQDGGQFITQPQAGISPSTFDDQLYLGAEAGMVLSMLDNAANPKQGFTLGAQTDLNIGLRTLQDDYLRLASDLTLYVSPHLDPQVTLAGRIGVAHNIGDFPFFEANTLGGKTNLRGWRSTRFAGRTSFYQNLDLRIKLLNYSTYIAIGELGLLAFFDNGRVWAGGGPMDGDTWHQGYGGGLWTLIFDAITLTGTVGFSSEETTVAVRFGYLF